MNEKTFILLAVGVAAYFMLTRKQVGELPPGSYEIPADTEAPCPAGYVKVRDPQFQGKVYCVPL